MKKKQRQNPQQLERERLKMSEKRKNNEYRTSENIAAKRSKEKTRQNQQYSETEQKRNKLSKFGTNIVACVEKFHNSIKSGPVFVCTCCHQTWFHEKGFKC